MGAKAKSDLFDTALSWMKTPVIAPAPLVAQVAGGVANYGAGLAQRDRYVRYLAGFVREWKALEPAERANLLDDPWAFRAFVHGSGSPALMQREAILHLVFPQTFEYSLASTDKRAIAKAFAGLPGVPGVDDDRALAVIRPAVEEAIGEPLNLYAAWFARIWGREEAGRWGEVLRWARRLLDTPDFDAEERPYKLVIADHMRTARRSLEDGGEWLGDLRRAFGSPNNLTSHFEHGPFLRWCDATPGDAATFLRRLWDADELTASHIDDSLALLPKEVLSSPSARVTLSAILLFAIDVTRYPPYRVGVVTKFAELLGETSGPPVDLEEESSLAGTARGGPAGRSPANSRSAARGPPADDRGEWRAVDDRPRGGACSRDAITARRCGHRWRRLRELP